MLSRNPQNINEYIWYYEEKGRIEVIHEIRDNDDSYVRSDHFVIPWRKLKKSLERKYEN
jgi:hypothetical protein